MVQSSQRSTTGAILLGASVNGVSLLPVFLTGAMAVQLTGDLGFGAAGLGLATSIYRGTGALVSPYFGKLTDRLGVTQAIRLAAVLGATSAIGLGAFTRSWTALVGWLLLAGCSQAFGRPAANRLLANSVNPKRLGTAFGIKNSAPPTATMLAGLAVPLVVLTHGWQRAYLLSAILPVFVFIAAGRRSPKPQRKVAAKARAAAATGRLANRRLMGTLIVCFGLGTMTSSVVTVFYVDAAVSAGLPEGFAGAMLAAGSASAIASRVLGGVISDRIATGHLKFCGGLLAVGSVGLFILAMDRPEAMVIGVLIALCGAWGFNGIFWYALVRSYPKSPGLITGALAPGALLGATVGPTVFGAVASLTAYPVSWTISGVVGFVAAAGMFYSDHAMRTAAPLIEYGETN